MSSKHAALKTVRTPMLEIAYEESGSPLNGNANRTIVLLHGWPYSIRQYDAVVSKLVAKQHDHSQRNTILVPYLRGFGGTHYLDPSEARSGQQAALAQDLLDFLDALAIHRALLVGFDWGGRAACCVAALQPARIIGLITCQGYAIQNIAVSASIPPAPRTAYVQWYQFYMNTPIGVRCLEVMQSRKEFLKFCWQLWSPHWHFTEAEYEESAKAFENKDFTQTTIHSYRHRWATVPGVAALQPVEEKLANEPKISVPTIAVRGGSDGVLPPSSDDTDKKHFTGFYEREILPRVGHCPPAEDPDAVVAAIEKLLRMEE